MSPHTRSDGWIAGGRSLDDGPGMFCRLIDLEPETGSVDCEVLPVDKAIGSHSIEQRDVYQRVRPIR